MRRDGIFDSDEHVVFSINNFWNASRDSAGRLRSDVWFEFHQIYPDVGGHEIWKRIQDDNDMKWLRECPVPIYTVEPFLDNPRAVVWPLDYYASKYRRYIACTFAVELMTALEEGFSEVVVYGLELLMGTKREATVEASNVAYWLGLLEGRGVKVSIMDGVDESGRDYHPLLLDHPWVYGMNYWAERRWVEEYCKRWDSLPQAV